MALLHLGCREDEALAPHARPQVPPLRAGGVPVVSSVVPVDIGGPGPNSWAYAVNAIGVVVGTKGMVAGLLNPFFALPALPDGNFNIAKGISETGFITGQGFLFTGQTRAFRVGLGTQWLDVLPTATVQASIGEDINDAGVVVGSSYEGSQKHAVMWTDPLLPIDLGQAGEESEAFGVNNAGQIVGAIRVGLAPFQAMRWDGPSTRVPLPPLPGHNEALAFDIASTGSAVGLSRPATTPQQRAVVWDASGQVRDLHGPCAALGGYASELRAVVARPSGLHLAVGSCLLLSGQISNLVWFIPSNGSVSVTALPLLPGSTSALAWDVSAAGRVVGVSYLAAGPQVATMWDVPLPNTAPTVTMGGPYTGNEGATIAFAATGSDADGDPLAYTWDFGDGSIGTGAAPTHAFPDNGTYTVTVTVSDGQAASSAITTATISNVAPSGSITSPPGATVPQGSFALTMGNIVEPGATDLASLLFRHNCGSTFSAPSSSPTATCNQPVPGAVTLRIAVRDKDGGSFTSTRAVTVVNVAPTVTLLSPSTVTIPKGGSASFSASFVDPGTSDNPWTARVRWGGSLGVQVLGPVTPGVPFGASKVYPAAGNYSASVEVADKYGALQRVNFRVVVQ